MTHDELFQAASVEAQRRADDMRAGEVRYIPAQFLIDGRYVPSGYHLRKVGLVHVEPLNRWRKP